MLDTLRACASGGFPADQVEASMNTVEFRLREFNTGGFPRGLSFMLGAMSEWLFDRDAIDALRFEAPLAELKAELASGKPVFEDLITSLLLENTHRVTVEMRPDAALEEEQAAAERAQLSAAADGMTADELAAVATATAALKAAQAAEDTPEAVATIPMVTMDDLDRVEKDISRDVGELAGVTSLTHELPTNGIVYADVGLDLRAVPLSELALLPLFTRLLLEVGAGARDEVELSRAIGARTGGLSASTMFSPRKAAAPDGADPAGSYVSAGDEVVAYLFVRGKATAERAGELFELAHDVLVDARLDNAKRAIEILKESVSRMESSLVGAGHQYADTRLAARLTAAGAVTEAMGGVSAFEALKSTLAQAESDWPSVRARLEAIRTTVRARARLARRARLAGTRS